MFNTLFTTSKNYAHVFLDNPIPIEGSEFFFSAALDVESIEPPIIPSLYYRIGIDLNEDAEIDENDQGQAAAIAEDFALLEPLGSELSQVVIKGLSEEKSDPLGNGFIPVKDNYQNQSLALASRPAKKNQSRSSQASN